MRTGARVLGILGGGLALCVIFVLYLGSGFGGHVWGGADLARLYLAIASGIAALGGAGIVVAKPIMGAAVMAIAAVTLVFSLLILAGINYVTLIPLILQIMGALLGFLSTRGPAKPQV